MTKKKQKKIKPEKSFWVVEHAHRHGPDYALVLATEEPTQEQMASLFDDVELERDDEFLSCVGPMTVKELA